jgi:dihydroxyacid dehydratase/phosphogluconate dehydratase
LFWYANIDNGTCGVCVGGRDESIIYVTDGKIYFSGQFVKPIVPFTVVPDQEDGGFIMRLGDNDCRMINVVALSLAMNGAHLLY